MIYRYLVVSKSPYPIRLDFSGCLSQGGIETAILVANRQVRASELDCHPTYTNDIFGPCS
jgi:hypothetical protein